MTKRMYHMNADFKVDSPRLTIWLNGMKLPREHPQYIWDTLSDISIRLCELCTQAFIAEYYIDEVTMLRDGEHLFSAGRHVVTIRNCGAEWSAQVSKDFRLVYVGDNDEHWDLDFCTMNVEVNNATENVKVRFDYHRATGSQDILDERDFLSMLT